MDDQPETKDDLAVVSKKRKTFAETTKELDRSPQSSFFFNDYGPLFYKIMEFLDPGLDWPSCRAVSTSWHKCILSTEKQWDGPDNKPSIWTGPVILENPTLYKKKLRSDFKLVRRTTKEERRKCRREPFWHEDIPYKLWARTDDKNLFRRIHEKPAIVTAQINFLCRNVYDLFDDDTELCSPNFSFAGARWCIMLGQYDCDTDPYDPNRLFGITLKRVKRWNASSDEMKRKNRGDPAPLVPNSLTCAVRYNALFGIHPQGMRFISKERTDLISLSGEIGDDDPDDNHEYIKLHTLEFALGPTPANVDSGHLRIKLELEFLGYGYAC